MFYKDSIEFLVLKNDFESQDFKIFGGRTNKLCTRFINADGSEKDERLISLIPFYFGNRIQIFGLMKQNMFKKKAVFYCCVSYFSDLTTYLNKFVKNRILTFGIVTSTPTLIFLSTYAK